MPVSLYEGFWPVSQSWPPRIPIVNSPRVSSNHMTLDNQLCFNYFIECVTKDLKHNESLH